MTDTSNILVYFMTMPERLTHINTQINAFPNSIIIESFNDINMIIPNTYVLEFKLKKKELCAYTYIKTLLTFLESNDDVCIIFEDDIIIKDEDYIVFVEVKYRKNFSYGRPKEFVNINKQNKLIKSAYTYISDNNIKSSQNFRFDVMEIFHKNKEIVICNDYTIIKLK